MSTAPGKEQSKSGKAWENEAEDRSRLDRQRVNISVGGVFSYDRQVVSDETLGVKMAFCATLEKQNSDKYK